MNNAIKRRYVYVSAEEFDEPGLEYDTEALADPAADAGIALDDEGKHGFL